MAGRDKQNTNVGREQGGDRFFVKEAGYMNFNDQDFTGKQLRLKNLSDQTMTQWGASGTSLSGTEFTPAYGYHMVTLATGLSTASAYMPDVPDVGAILVIDGTKMVGDGNLSIHALSTAVLVVDQGSIAISSLEMSAAAIVKFLAINATTWAIVEQNASVTTRATA